MTVSPPAVAFAYGITQAQPLVRHALVERRGMNKGGPATEEGKEVVRWNAAKHGLRSPAPVVPGIEKAEDWEAHGAGVLESLKPEGHLETVLAERVALLSWRLHR